MKYVRISLQYKILLGYLILVAVIGSMVAILLYERKRMKEIEVELTEIRKVRRDINTVHRRLMELSTLGESVIVWDASDRRAYGECRSEVDSLLLSIGDSCLSVVRREQIDSLRRLLADKEIHLGHIVRAIHEQRKTDSVMRRRLPEVTRRAAEVKTVVRRKNSLAGRLFGKKETVYIPPSTKELDRLSDCICGIQKRYVSDISAYVDSLKTRNRMLNDRLHDFISELDSQAQVAFQVKTDKISDAQDLSYRLFAFVIVGAGLLLFGSLLIIRCDLKKEERVKCRMRHVIDENERLLRMRRNIILTVSHDIRGPLGNITNCAELASVTREKKRRDVYLEDIRQSCRHILHLVNDLMDVYRINEVKDTKNEIPFSLERFLKRVADEYRRKANDKALIFKFECKGTADVTVNGDADKLERILDNLLTNAVKFTLSGTVRLSAAYDAGRLTLEVGDTGVGMDDEELERAFIPFERSSQNVNSEGFGLGLFITKGLVQVLGGTLQVTSRPGAGTVFTLAFPLPEVSGQTIAGEVPDVPVGRLPRKVMVVDDDPLQLKIAEDLLGRNGVECTACRNAQEVVDALRRSDYDLIMTDIQMRPLDGFGLLKLLRSSRIGNSRTVPVAVMTAREDGASGVYVRSGFCGCIHKPFGMKDLLRFISDMYSNAGTAEESVKFDFSILLDCTEDKAGMLEVAEKETEMERRELEEALERCDREALRAVVHRMLPLWEQLGVRGILEEFRRTLYDESAGDDAVRKGAAVVLACIEELMNEVQRMREDYGKDDSCSGG